MSCCCYLCGKIHSVIDSAARPGTQSDDVYGNLYEEIYAGQ